MEGSRQGGKERKVLAANPTRVGGLGQVSTVPGAVVGPIGAVVDIWRTGPEAAKGVWDFFFPPEIEPPDLTPEAPQVGFSPETVSLYTGERRARDIEMTKQVAEANQEQDTEMSVFMIAVAALVGFVIAR